MQFAFLLEYCKKQINHPQARLVFFIVGLILFYLIGFLVLLQPMQVKKEIVLKQIEALKVQLTESEQQINVINQAIQSGPLAKILAQQQKFSSEIQSLEQRLIKATPVLMSTDEWIKLKKMIISQQNDIDSQITLISIRDLPRQKIDGNDFVNSNIGDIYQDVVEVEFQANYFSAIEYLSRLEKLPWQLYWDSLQYKVLTYPKADVILQFHIFTKQKNIL